MDKQYPITGISREDILEITGDERVKSLSDEDMELFAQHLADAYVGEQLCADVNEIWEHRFAPGVNPASYKAA